jgi:hypothetical protein
MSAWRGGPPATVPTMIEHHKQLTLHPEKTPQQRNSTAV